MKQSNVATPTQYLASLPPERRKLIEAVRSVIRKNLPKGYQETMNWGMISYEIPLKKYPNTYNGQPLGYAGLAAQKNYCSLHLMSVYADPKLKRQFEDEWKKSGKKLNMGKSCIRFNSIEDIALDLIGKTIAATSVEQYIKLYERSRR